MKRELTADQMAKELQATRNYSQVIARPRKPEDGKQFVRIFVERKEQSNNQKEQNE